MILVLIEIDDEVWEIYKKSMALLGVRTHEELVRMIEIQLWEESYGCIEDGKKQLMSDEPEALVLRAIGLMEEKKTMLEQ